MRLNHFRQAAFTEDPAHCNTESFSNLHDTQTQHPRFMQGAGDRASERPAEVWFIPEVFRPRQVEATQECQNMRLGSFRCAGDLMSRVNCRAIDCLRSPQNITCQSCVYFRRRGCAPFDLAAPCCSHLRGTKTRVLHNFLSHRFEYCWTAQSCG